MSTSAPCGDPPQAMNTGCSCGAWFGVVPPPPCPFHFSCVPTYHTVPVATVHQFTPTAPSISDADIERIAQRAAAILGEKRPISVVLGDDMSAESPHARHMRAVDALARKIAGEPIPHRPSGEE